MSASASLKVQQACQRQRSVNAKTAEMPANVFEFYLAEIKQV